MSPNTASELGPFKETGAIGMRNSVILEEKDMRVTQTDSVVIAAAPIEVSPRDLSRMSQDEFVRLYKAAAAEEELARKCGRLQNRNERRRRTHNGGRASNESSVRELIPYPTGQTHGRGGFNLADFLLRKSGVGKEDYKVFIASVRQAVQAAGVPRTATWKDVRGGPLAEILDNVFEQFPWLRDYKYDWPTKIAVKQYLRNCRNSSYRKTRASPTRITDATDAAA